METLVRIPTLDTERLVLRAPQVSDFEAYAEFCENRKELEAKEADAQPLKVARDELQSRMRRRRRRRSGGAAGTDVITSLFHAG